MKRSDYTAQLAPLELAVVETQAWLMETGQKVLVLFEGRDSAGKDGAISTLTRRMSQRATRVVALPKPTEEEKSQWYLQRFVPHLPAARRVVIFNRSWYNRAGVEPVMGFCTPEQTETFLQDVVPFERMLDDDGVTIIKYWLNISREVQA